MKNKQRSTDLIIGRGLLTAETIAQELRDRLERELGERRWFLPQEFLLIEARRILAEYEPILAENIAQADLAAYLAGFNDVAKRLPPSAAQLFQRSFGGFPPPPRFTLPGLFGDKPDPIVRFPQIEQAAQSLLDRNILTRAQFDAADDAARGRAFTIAGDLSRDTIETVRDVLAETIDRGASLEQFRRNLGERLEKSFAGPGHLENVFRTNIQAAYHAGHDKLASDPIVSEVFPYQEYLPIHDARARHDHVALGKLGIDGTGVYRRDDTAFWNIFTPPWAWQCRCGINLLTIEAAARRGVQEAATWLRTGAKPPLVSRLPFVPFRPPAGFVSGRRVAA
ncbi:MAG: phage minor head protein [Pirellulaceae bacterium]